MRLLWSQTVSSRLRGLSLAREAGLILAWDVGSWLYLLDRKGERQAQRPAPAALVAACAADDGHTFAAVGQQGQVWLLAPDLSPRWETRVAARGLAVALDPLGRYLAVADGGGGLSLLDRLGRLLWRVTAPRPLRYLAFVPEQPLLVAAADFGLAACFDETGQCRWREGLVANVGSLAVTGDGSIVALACFTDGLCSVAVTSPRLQHLGGTAPCRLAALSYEGDLMLTAGLDMGIELREWSGQVRSEMTLEGMAVDLALGALGTPAVVALAEGQILALDTRTEPPR